MGESYHVIILPEAADDMVALHDYIALDSPDNAARMVDRILKAIELLKTAPHRTVAERQSPKIRRPVRSLPVRPYVVYFRVSDEHRAVHILTVRHGSRRRPRFPRNQ